jgi:hypothetical protein
MSPRAQFVCQSPTCRRQAHIEIGTSKEMRKVSSPRCTCGSEMKRVYSAPVVRELSKEEGALRFGDIDPPKSAGKSAG